MDGESLGLRLGLPDGLVEGDLVGETVGLVLGDFGIITKDVGWSQIVQSDLFQQTSEIKKSHKRRR